MEDATAPGPSQDVSEAERIERLERAVVRLQELSILLANRNDLVDTGLKDIVARIHDLETAVRVLAPMKGAQN